jgi:hypothetical protein
MRGAVVLAGATLAGGRLNCIKLILSKGPKRRTTAGSSAKIWCQAKKHIAKYRKLTNFCLPGAAAV